MEQKKRMIQLDIRVQWGDMDAMQHVNNTIYLKWVESARLLLFEKLIAGNEKAPTISPILAWQDIKYISPVVYPDTVTIDFDIVGVEEDRLHAVAELYSSAQNRLVAISKSTLKAYDITQLKKVEIPSQWLSVLRTYYNDLF